MRNKPYVILIVLLAMCPLEIAVINLWAICKKRALINDSEAKLSAWQLNKRLKHEKEKKALNDEFEKNRYLATGDNVYERIYNKQGQSIINLIEGLSKEAFPDNWQCEAKVEEFTNFILLVHAPVKNSEFQISEIMKYTIPIITYTKPYLKNVCLFDKNHKCILFFDGIALAELDAKRKLDSKTILDVKHKGEMFTRYNSVRIDCKKLRGHIFIPVTVSGEYGIHDCFMMLDTGASMTVISLELAGKTGGEDLNLVRREYFHTVKGPMSCPIVERSILVGGIGQRQTVAVNLQDTTNLLGVDFFQDKNYTIDSSSNCIYIWAK